MEPGFDVSAFYVSKDSGTGQVSYGIVLKNKGTEPLCFTVQNGVSFTVQPSEEVTIHNQIADSAA